MSFADRAERAAAALVDALRRPAGLALLYATIVLLGIVVRIGRAPDANDIFAGDVPDGKQYFVDAYGLHLHGFFEPFAHRAHGWPLLLAAGLHLFGFVGTSGFSMSMDAPFDAEGAQAIFFAYAFHAMIAAALVAATIVLARELVGPLTSAVAGLFVAIDPFLLQQSTTVMADSIFAVLVVLAFACVLRARRHAGWLALAGALAALSHMARVNGLLVVGALVLFAALYLPRASPRHRAWHLAVPLAVAALVALPYLLWRAQHLPHAFDYGANQRFWADDMWNMSDAYWASYTYAGGGVRETAADYFATHTMGEALLRFYRSGQWQLLDLTRVVLTPMLLVLGVTGMAHTRREAWSSMTPILGLTLAATFVWVYPIVRSPRYFLVLIPFFAVLAAAGAARAAALTQWATLSALAIIAPYVVTYGVEPLLVAPKALVVLRDAHAGPMVVLLGAALVLSVSVPVLARPLAAALRRVRQGNATHP